MTAFASESQQVTVTVDVAGLPVVAALALAARDLVDHAEDGPTHPGGETWPIVRPADLRALEAALAPLFPGPAA